MPTAPTHQRTPAAVRARGRALLKQAHQQATADRNRRLRVQAAAQAAASEHKVDYRLKRVPLTNAEKDARRHAVAASR
jgi:hypothetical protein